MKLHSDRICPNSGKQLGYLWHYGHFVHDLLMPLNDWLFKNAIDPSDFTLYINDVPDQSIGQFVGIVESLLGISVEQISEPEFRALDLATLDLKGYLSGPFSNLTFQNIQSAIKSRFRLHRSSRYPKIVLIERGVGRHGFEHDLTLKERPRSTGAQRRQIGNHRQLAQLLEGRYGQSFVNVVLEDVAFEDQVELFHHAYMVVALHGAGLNNMIWMKASKGVIIEIGSHRKNSIFKNMSQGKGLRYYTIGEPKNWNRHHLNASHAYNLDLEHFDRLLNSIESRDQQLINYKA